MVSIRDRRWLGPRAPDFGEPVGSTIGGVSAERTSLKDSFSALRIPEFRRFWGAALVSSSGSWLQGLATPFVMLRITDSASWVGASVFSIALPMALMGPIAGPLADRVPRRQVLIVTQVLLAAVAGLFALSWWFGIRNPWAYIGLSLTYGAVNGFNMPSWQAFVADLVPRHELMNAITLNSAQFNAARAIGPSIGGIVLAVLGPGWSFAGNAFSFLAVVAVLVSLPRPPPVDRDVGAGGGAVRPWGQFLDGLAHARESRGIVASFVVAFALAVLGGTLVQVHLVLFAERVFAVDEFRFGLLVSAYGIGAISIAPWLGAFGPRFRRGTLMAAGLGLFGLAELALSSTAVFGVGLASVFLAGCAHLTTASSNNTTVQLLVGDHMRGRVMSLYLMVFTLGVPLGAIIQGPLADRFGVRPVVSTMGALLMAAAVLLRVTGALDAADVSAEDPVVVSTS